MNGYCIFLSNYFNHHQKPFSDAMYNRIGDKYLFIQTSPMDEERKRLGWQINDNISYLINSEELLRNESKYIKMITEADVVLMGSAPEYLIKERMKRGKLVLRYSERFFKKSFELWKYPIRYIRWHRYIPNGKPVYMLCASAFTSADFKKLGLLKNKCYKWGYFPEVKKYDNVKGMIEQKKKNSILWVGRIIDWKHPELAVEVANRLKSDGYDFTLNIIGTGEMEKDIQALVKTYGLEDYVKLLGAMAPEKVREHMEESEVFLFTSDRGEGWGAVLNEAMNSGCAAVACHIIGSVPFLIKDGKNGVIYQDGNTEDIYKKVKSLLDEPEKRKKIGLKAFETLDEIWNAEQGTERLLKLLDALLKGEKNPRLFESGPCSKAEVLKDGWYKG